MAQLVNQLDGLPLALELAAARMDALSLPTLARRISGRLRLLHWEAGDVPERQHRLEAAIGWSYNLLTTPEQRVFRHLGVFVGCVSPDALAAVLGRADESEGEACSVAEINSLAQKSLIVTEHLKEAQVHADANGDEEGKEEREPAFRVLEPCASTPMSG